jgi:hypothetical protein
MPPSANAGTPRSNYRHALAALKPKPRFVGRVCRTDRRNILRRAAAVVFLIILAGLIIYGSTNLRTASVLDDATTGRRIPAAPTPPAHLFPSSPNL